MHRFRRQEINKPSNFGYLLHVLYKSNYYREILLIFTGYYTVSSYSNKCNKMRNLVELVYYLHRMPSAVNASITTKHGKRQYSALVHTADATSTGGSIIVGGSHFTALFPGNYGRLTYLLMTSQCSPFQ